MRKTVVAGLVVVALAGCSQQADSETEANELPAATTAEETAAPATPSGPARNDRGNIVKALGEPGGVSNLAVENGEKQLITFAIDAIAPVTCTEDYASPAENGHLVAVDLRVATAPELSEVPDLGYFTIGSSDWQFVGADGVTISALDTIATYGCLDQQSMFPSDPLAPGSRYVGKLVFDLPATTGSLIYRPYIADGGWEWSF